MTVSQHAHQLDCEAEAAKWNAGIIKCIVPSYTAFPAVTGQSVFCEKDQLR